MTETEALRERVRALEAENTRLREALDGVLWMAEAWHDYQRDHGGYDPINGDWAEGAYHRDKAAIERAKAVLEGGNYGQE